MHAQSSVKRWGGTVEDYLPIHEKMDSTKMAHAEVTHRCVFHSAFGIFFTPVDMNTWCNQRHNVPYVFPETQQADNFTPPAALFDTGMNFGTPVLGTGALTPTTVSFTAFDSHAPAQYVQQWNGSAQKCRARCRRRPISSWPARAQARSSRKPTSTASRC